MFRRCTGRAPTADEERALLDALGSFRERYALMPEDATALLAVGTTPTDVALAPDELAAWTMIANALFSLDATITRG